MDYLPGGMRRHVDGALIPGPRLLLEDDDGPRIQRALDLCAAQGGGHVYLPPGTYYGRPNVPPGVTLRGAR